MAYLRELYTLGSFHAINAGQPKVEDNQQPVLGKRQAQALATVVGHSNLVTEILEVQRGEFRDIGFILYEKYSTSHQVYHLVIRLR